MQLVAYDIAGSLVARGVPDGFVLVIRGGLYEQHLECQRGRVRVFKKLDSVASYLRRVGVQSFGVELPDYEAESLT